MGTERGEAESGGVKSVSASEWDRGARLPTRFVPSLSLPRPPPPRALCFLLLFCTTGVLLFPFPSPARAVSEIGGISYIGTPGRAPAVHAATSPALSLTKLHKNDLPPRHTPPPRSFHWSRRTHSRRFLVNFIFRTYSARTCNTSVKQHRRRARFKRNETAAVNVLEPTLLELHFTRLLLHLRQKKN